MATETREGNGSRTLTFSQFINTAEDLKQLDIRDEYQAACALLFALAAFEKDETAGKEMFEYINGPEDMNGFDISFIRDQLSRYPYVIRSYFSGATADNNYQPEEPLSITIRENIYSRREENYVQLLLRSGGADSDRMFKLRRKPSTGEWFVFADTYRGLLAGIRPPKAEDKWA